MMLYLPCIIIVNIIILTIDRRKRANDTAPSFGENTTTSRKVQGTAERKGNTTIIH